jgi:hypothetical protein
VANTELLVTYWEIGRTLLEQAATQLSTTGKTGDSLITQSAVARLSTISNDSPILQQSAAKLQEHENQHFDRYSNRSGIY